MGNHGRTLSWLHLSDLHCCPALDGGNGKLVLQRLRQDLKKLLEGAPPVDLLLFTGDAAFGQIPEQPLAEQLEAAWYFFEEVRELCRLPPERVFVVPGNHDVDRSMVSEASQTWLRQLAAEGNWQRIHQLVERDEDDWKPFAARLECYRDWIAQAYPHLNDRPDRHVWSQLVEIDGLRVGLAGLDSAWSCSEDGEKGKLWAGTMAQLGMTLPQLADADVRLALIHHPPSWLVEQEDRQPFRSRLQTEFHVLLHGHEHDSWVQSPQPDHLMISAGAAHDRGGRVPFGYNLVRWVLDAERGEVWLRHWDERTGQWGPDTIPSRTDHRGVWQLRSLPWKPQRQTEDTPALVQPGQAQAEQQPTLTAAERRGIFGREKELRKLRRLLEEKRLVWLHGLSGIGKTSVIDQVGHEIGYDLRRVSIQQGMELEEIYRLFARELEAPDADERLLGVGGRITFDPLRRWGRRFTRKVLLHVEGADHWLTTAPDQRIADLLEAVVLQIPGEKVAVVVESTLAPESFLPKSAEKFHLHGLGTECLAAFFRQPLPGLRPDLSWILTEEELDTVAAHVAGDRGRRKDLHPFALVLLVQVAAGLSLRPPELLTQHVRLFEHRLEEELFQILVDKVLQEAERRLLRLLALYREGVAIPKDHAETLGSRIEPAAFGSLVRRSVLGLRPEGFHLHSLLRQITAQHLDPQTDEVLDDHAAIAEAWLSGVRRGRRLKLGEILANNEAFYHLATAQLYVKLAELEAEHLRQETIPHLHRLNLQLKNEGRRNDHRLVLELWRQLDPTDPRPFRFLGETLVALEGPASDAALDAFRQAVDLNPVHAPHWSGLGRCLLARGEGAEFITALEGLPLSDREKVLKDDYNLGIYAAALEADGQTAEARKMRQQRIDAEARHPALYNDQAKAFLEANQPKRALDILDLARQRSVENDYNLSIRGQVLERLGRAGDALQERQQRIDAEARDPALYVDQAKAFLEANQPKRALDILDLARQRGVEDDYSLSIRGQVLERLGRADEALQERQQRIDAGTRNPVLYHDQAKALLDAKQPERALEILEDAKKKGIRDDYTDPLEARIRKALQVARD